MLLGGKYERFNAGDYRKFIEYRLTGTPQRTTLFDRGFTLYKCFVYITIM